MKSLWIFFVGLVLTLAGGCTFAPRYQRPEAPMPATWPADSLPRHTQATTAPLAADIPWQKFLIDQRLRNIVQLALDNNRDLRLAALNVERVRALYDIQRSSLYPTLNATGSVIRQRLPADPSSSEKSTTSSHYSVTAGTIAWEIDFFGRLRSLEQGALEEFLATRQARNSAQMLLVESVAGAYLALAADRENLALAQTTLESQQSALDLVQRLFDRGAVPELDVHRARTQVDSARGAVALFTQRVALDRNALPLLAGGPVPVAFLPENLADVAPLPEISAGVPSEVLLSRPDILQAEHRLRAAYANIGAARAAFFPRISLTAAAGTASRELSGLFESGSGTWSFAPQVVMPIFDARLWAAVRVSKVDQRMALTEYERAIQTSFYEVSNALAVRGTVNEHVAAQESLVKSVVETYRLSRLRYERGIDSYLSVLDAQRSLYTAQQSLVSLRLAKLASQLRLYAVLGGGWQPEPDAADQPHPSTRAGQDMRKRRTAGAPH